MKCIYLCVRVCEYACVCDVVRVYGYDIKHADVHICTFVVIC